MKAQAEYLDALKNNDVVKLRQIQRKYASKTEKTPNLCELLFQIVACIVFLFLPLPLSVVQGLADSPNFSSPKNLFMLWSFH